MTYAMAKIILEGQHKALKKVDGTRFMHKGYEYKVVYEGGFSSYVGIYRRLVGKRNFKYFSGFGAYECGDASEVMSKVMELVSETMGVGK